MTWKYYAKKILYYLRQQKILNNLKAFLQQPDDYESYLEGGYFRACEQGSLAAEQQLSLQVGEKESHASGLQEVGLQSTQHSNFQQIPVASSASAQMI